MRGLWRWKRVTRLLAAGSVGCLLTAALPWWASASGTVGFSGNVLQVENRLGFGPLRASVTAVGRVAGLRLSAANTGSAPRRLRLEAFNADFSPAPAIAMPGTIVLAPGQRRALVISVPVEPGTDRRLRICATDGRHFRICGKYILRAL